MLYTQARRAAQRRGAELRQPRRAAEPAPEFDGLKEGDDLLSYLLMAWVGDHIFSYAQCYSSGWW